MDQQKIGKFISELRKEKNLTQSQLAEKLGVTDRAISNYETGRRMPELSLIKPLCNELGITINDLLSGERIDKEVYQEKFEENVINTIDYSNKKIKRNSILLKSMIGGILITILSISILFSIDIKRMNNNQPVSFSTWGFDYCPPINLRDKEIEIAIEDYLIDKSNQNKRHDNDVTFVSFKTLLIEEKNNYTLFNIYAWVLEERYYLGNNEIIQDGSSSIPYKFVVELIDDTFIVTDSRIPRDGSYYADDIRNIFPKDVRNKLEKIHQDGTVDKLILENKQKVDLYYHEYK